MLEIFTILLLANTFAYIIMGLYGCRDKNGNMILGVMLVTVVLLVPVLTALQMIFIGFLHILK